MEVYILQIKEGFRRAIFGCKSLMDFLINENQSKKKENFLKDFSIIIGGKVDETKKKFSISHDFISFQAYCERLKL